MYLFLLFFILRPAAGELVTIDDGTIEGAVLTSALGVSFNAFFRVPYARAPVENLRFEDPQEVQRWNDTRNGTYYGPMCYQVDHLVDFDMSEDCLHLNVFTKNLTESKPVFFCEFTSEYFEVSCEISIIRSILFKCRRPWWCV